MHTISRRVGKFEYISFFKILVMESDGTNEDNNNSYRLKRYCLSRRVPVWCCRWTKITTSTYAVSSTNAFKPTFQTGFRMPILLAFCLLSDTYGLSFSLASHLGVLELLGWRSPRLSFERKRKISLVWWGGKRLKTRLFDITCDVTL